jgi:hypothetical protein
MPHTCVLELHKRFVGRLEQVRTMIASPGRSRITKQKIEILAQCLELTFITVAEMINFSKKPTRKFFSRSP